ncbi:ABC transporter permease [Weissella minor]|uniref:Transport permease protein n=1 Tax=Weissella minor TaxID=1620 RepID=A0A0R2JTD3_9LACO|nr:ABC transporter permease [Weissella minor]KRN77540.1 ABC-2 type transporter [Weissella minor]
MKPNQFRTQHYLGMKGLKIIVNNELKAFFRNKGLIISQLVQPILYYIFIVLGINNFVSKVDYAGKSIAYADYALTGILGILIISQMTQAIYRITIDKRYGLLALKRQSGVSPFYYIIGMSVYPMIGIFIQSIVLYLIARLFGSAIGLVNYLAGIGVVIIVLYFWTAIAALITIKINDYQRRDAIISFIITPLGFTAPAFYLISNVPTFIKVIGYFNPLTYQLYAIRSVVFDTPVAKGPIIALTLLATIVMIGLASYAVARMSLVLTER